MAYNNNGGPSLLLILIYGWKAFFLGFILLAVIICFPFRLLFSATRIRPFVIGCCLMRKCIKSKLSGMKNIQKNHRTAA